MLGGNGLIRYHAYGLNILSEILVPEFEFANYTGPKTVQHSEKSEASEVIIRLISQVAESGFMGDEPQEFVFDHAQAVFPIDDVGIFRVRNGKEIVVQPAPGADPRQLRTILIGNVMAALLYQRGYLILHASTVQIGTHGLAFVGAPGSGKSSISLSLYTRGHRVVSDDVSAVDTRSDHPVVLPGYPQLKVSANAALSLGYDAQTLIPLHEQEEKRGLRCERGFLTEPVQLDCIYILSNQGASGVERLSSQDALVELVRHSLPTRIPQSAEASDFLQCVAVVRQVPIYRLPNVPSLRDLTELAVMVERHQAEIVLQP
jgi:hypothetical protein